MLTRRDFLRLALTGGGLTLVGSLALAWQRAVQPQQAPFGRGPMGGGPMGPGGGMGPAGPGGPMGGMGGMGGMMGDSTTPNVASALQVPLFQRPLPLPAEARPVRMDGTTDYYELTMRPARVEILPGYQTTVWGFDGQVPGPTIRARRGRRVVVRQTNRLTVPTSTHLHGGHVAPDMDGHPTDLVRPGQSKEYVYPNNQPGATLWYHDHAMDGTAPHVYMGLAGFYLLEDPDEAAFGLPSGAYDVPLVIQDRAFAADGSLLYPGNAAMPLLMSGFLGDTLLVNSAPYPYFQVATRKYRLRILNGSNARHYLLTLANDQPFTVIGTDGGLLPAPVNAPVLSLAPAERVEVVVDFSQVPVGGSVVLQNQMGQGSLAKVMRFDVVHREPDDSRVPSTLRPLERLDPGQAVQTRDWTLNMQMGPGAMFGGGAPWVINGQSFDPKRVDARPRLETVEVWRFTNPSMMMHPMHIHDIMFQVLDRNGQPPAPQEAGWKDTVDVNAGETVRVITRFTDYRGTYVFHCHNLEHEDRAMMSQFEVV